MTLGGLFRSNLFRYTLNYMVGVSIAVFVVLAVVYASLTYRYFRELNDLVGTETRMLSQRFESAGIDGVVETIAVRIQEPGFPRLFYLILDRDGHKRVGNIGRWPERLGPIEEWLGFGASLRSWLYDGQQHDFIGATTLFADGDRLLVARNYQDIQEYLRLTLTVLLQAMLATILLGGVGAALLTLFLERRIEAVNTSIATILAGDLRARLPDMSRRNPDDFQRLIVNFNHMLDRIVQLMDDVKQLSSNIAHDLRTPLTRLRNNLANMQETSLAEHRPVVAGMIEEADALLATFNALLRITQIESGNQRSGFARSDLATILRDVGELYEPLAAEKGQELLLDLPATCQGVVDRDLLFQAVANLLDNAIKYAPAGGRLGLKLSTDSASVSIDVHDSGPGIPYTEREQVFRRFYRIEKSRGQHPGNGLGLSLVKAVVQLHGGTITLSDNAPGLRVTVRLPPLPT